MRVRIGIILLICWGCISSAHTQDLPPSLQIGVGLSGFSYEGDFTVGENDFRRAYPGGTLSLQFVGKRPLQLQVQVGFGKIIEQQDMPDLFLPSEASPNTFVQTSLFFTELRFRYRFFHRKRIQPFLGMGGGMMFFTPRDAEGNFLSENIFTRPDFEEYETTVPVVPLFGGVLVNVNQFLALSLDYTYRLVSSDYLDNVGTLGRHEGNDILHTASITAYIKLQPKEAPEPKPEPEPVPETPEVIAILDSGWLDMWEAMYPVNADLPPEVEDIPQRPDDLYQQLVYTNLPPGTENWQQVEQRAIRLDQILKVRLPAEASLEELAKSFKVQPETLQTLNPDLSFPVPANTVLRLPDMRGI